MLSLNYRPQSNSYFLARIRCPHCGAFLQVCTSRFDGSERHTWGRCHNSDCEWYGCVGHIVITFETKEVQRCN